MKRMLFPSADSSFHRKTSSGESRSGTITVHRNFNGTMLVDNSLLRTRTAGELIGVDTDHPVRYEHEIYDVFDQFLETR